MTPAAASASDTTIKVLIADDQALVRGAFGALVDAVPGMTVVATAADGIEAVELAAAERPDVVLMDVRMPRMDGIAATKRLIEDARASERDVSAEANADADGATDGATARAADGSTNGPCPNPCPSPRVLILTTFDLDEYVFSALRVGASGFLLKDTPPADLVAAIRVIAQGEALLAPSVTRRLIAEFAARPEPASSPRIGLEGVTEREREVLVLIGRGLSNHEIANYLHVAEPTVKTHVGRLLTKLAARDRAQLVIAAYESGLLTGS